MAENDGKFFDGGPAFPQGKRVGDVSETEGGMTLRDYFAAAALTGILSGKYWEVTTIDDPITESYKIADAMLKERQK